MTVKLTEPVIRFSGFSHAWREKSFGQITNRIVNPVEVEETEQYRQIGIRSHGKGIFHKAAVDGKSLGNKRVFWVENDALVVNIVFAWEQAVAVTSSSETGMIASHRFPMYLAKEREADIHYLYYFFLTRKGKSLLELASPGGAGRNKTLGQKEFENLKFLVPDYEEQRQIAGFMSMIEERIIQLKKKQELLELYFTGCLQQVFSQELRFKTEESKAFPDWQLKSLGDIGVPYGGLSGKTKDDFGSGKRYIQYKQVFDSSKIDISRTELVQIGPHENQNAVKYGDVFFTVSSETPREIGMSAVLLDEVEETYLNSFCFGYRPNSLRELVPEFARFLFRSPQLRTKIEKLAQGSTRYNMSKNQLMRINVMLPGEAEQRKIAAFFTGLQERMDFLHRQLRATDNYKQVLLQQMFI